MLADRFAADSQINCNSFQVLVVALVVKEITSMLQLTENLWEFSVDTSYWNTVQSELHFIIQTKK